MPTVCTGSRTAKAWELSLYQPLRLELLDENGVGFLQDLHALGGDGAGDAHGQSGAREGMAPDHVVGKAQGQTRAAHFIFE